MPIIKIEDLRKVYKTAQGAIEALKGISLEIFKGEIIGLLGVNGAGKTTLSSIIATLHAPTSGNIYFRGGSIYKDIINFRREIGFCPQKPNFDKQLTIEENLLFAGRYYLMSDKEAKVRAQELMEQFELTRYAKSTAEILSGGYKQRLLIARALIHRPSIVILDEPTVALDPHIRRQLWNNIIALKKSGVTVILTTHYLDEAEILSDRVCILHKGAVRLIDSPANLLSVYNKSKLEDVFLQLMQENNNGNN